jgi:hypothetical protein
MARKIAITFENISAQLTRAMPSESYRYTEVSACVQLNVSIY